ncbi:MAG: class II aldolase/adducin family protein [Pseudomonadota bacterium]|nr:class II aldolase/adducin family protein [Pseudomonadota bacterium]
MPTPWGNQLLITVRLAACAAWNAAALLATPVDAVLAAPVVHHPGVNVALPDTDEQRIDDLIVANHILFDQGVLDAFGHISVRSARNPSHFFLSRSRAPGLVTRADILEFDADSNPIDPRGEPLYGERFIHGEIFRARADVQSVVHSHSPAVIAFGVTPVPLRPVLHMAGFLPQSVPVFEIRDVAGADNDMLVRDTPLGAALARVLGNASVALMRGHGMVVVGPSVRHAVFRAIYTQLDAQIEIEALKLGPVEFLNAGEASKVDAVNEGGLLTGNARQWQLWQAQSEAHAQAPAISHK